MASHTVPFKDRDVRSRSNGSEASTTGAGHTEAAVGVVIIDLQERETAVGTRLGFGLDHIFASISRSPARSSPRAVR